MNKKAQIYILAALLFAIVIYGLSAVPNVVKTYEFKGDFNKLAGNYDVESSKLINSVIISGGDVKESFTNFTTLFMSYSKAQNPNFGLIYSLNYEDNLRIGNYLKQKIKIYDGKNDIDLNGCFDKISSQIIFNGLVLEMEAADFEALGDCFEDIPSTDKIWIGFEEDEGEIIWYPFEIEQNRPQLMIVNLMQEGPQRQVSVAGEGYVEEEKREEEKEEEMQET